MYHSRDEMRRTKYDTQYLILNPVQNVNVGITGGTPQLYSISPNGISNGIAQYYFFAQRQLRFSANKPLHIAQFGFQLLTLAECLPYPCQRSVSMQLEVFYILTCETALFNFSRRHVSLSKVKVAQVDAPFIQPNLLQFLLEFAGGQKSIQNQYAILVLADNQKTSLWW